MVIDSAAARRRQVPFDPSDSVTDHVDPPVDVPYPSVRGAAGHVVVGVFDGASDVSVRADAARPEAGDVFDSLVNIFRLIAAIGVVIDGLVDVFVLLAGGWRGVIADCALCAGIVIAVCVPGKII